MGLLEKRGIAAFQDHHFGKIVEEINQLAGFNLELEVKWEHLAVEDYSHLYEEGFMKVYFTPIIEALKDITSDEMGKEALKETLHKIIITNEKDHSSLPNALSFSDGVLTFDHNPITNLDYYEERTNELSKFLMKLM